MKKHIHILRRLYVYNEIIPIGIVEVGMERQTICGMTAFGRRLRYWRVRRGLGQTALGIASGYSTASSASAISQIESGRMAPALDKILSLAAALDVDVAAFFVDELPTHTDCLDASEISVTARAAMRMLISCLEKS